MVTLTEDQERMLAQHAAARNCSPAQALQALLSQPMPRKRAWSPTELDYLRDPRNSPRNIAALTGRSVSSVSVRRHQLAKEENLPALMRPARTPPADPA